MVPILWAPPSAKLLRFGKGSGHCFVAGFKGAILKASRFHITAGFIGSPFSWRGDFCFIIAGGLVTSNDGGLSIPDWPRSFGSFSVPELHGGVQYEWSHRAIAGSIILLTISIAGWTFFADRRRWMKWLVLLPWER